MRSWLFTTLASAIAVGVACSASNPSEFGDEAPPETSAGPTGGATGAGGLFQPSGSTGTGPLSEEPPCDQADPDADGDADGFTGAQGDCNDCTAQMNPGAYDYEGNKVDEDCNGTPDDEPTGCDKGLAIDGKDPLDAARAIDLCRMQSGASWGVVSAKWTLADGTDASVLKGQAILNGCVLANKAPNAQSHGLLPSFGSAISPRRGGTMAAISSGVARPGSTPATPPGMGDSPGGAEMCTGSKTPPGFPKDSPACMGVQTANDPYAFDPMALELEVKAPSNAKAFSFDFDFYTYEWPEFVCTVYNDFFVALLESQNPTVPADKNISFDSQGNPVSVNNGFVEVCDKAIGESNPGGKNFPCKLGTGELAATGFETDHAATSWLVTKASIEPGEKLRIRFAVWDMGDEVLDSTVLLDNFQWDVEGACGGPTTEEVPK